MCYLHTPMRIRRLFAVLDLLVALLLALGVFVGLPDRWLYVDVPALGLIALFGASAVGLLLGARWGETCARITGAAALACGLLLVALLAIAASYLFGIYGPVGKGGALIFVFVLFLAIPYLVVLPLAQWLWFARRASMAPSGCKSAAAKPRTSGETA